MSQKVSPLQQQQLQSVYQDNRLSSSTNDEENAIIQNRQLQGSPSSSYNNDTIFTNQHIKKVEKPVAVKPGFRKVGGRKEGQKSCHQLNTPPSLTRIPEDSSNPLPTPFYQHKFQNTSQFQQFNAQQPLNQQYQQYQFPQIFEPRSCEALDNQLRMEFPYLPQHLAMLMMSYKMSIEAQASQNQNQQQQQQQQQQIGGMENNLLGYYMQQMQQQQQNLQQQPLQQQQQEFLQQQNKLAQQQQQQQQQQTQQQQYGYQPFMSQPDLGKSRNNDEPIKKIIKKKIQKPMQNKQPLNDRSREQQKKEREETKNILRNTGNAIKNFHKEQECREIILELLNNNEDLFKQYYSSFLPQKLEKFEDFQEIWHVDNINDDSFKLKKAFRNVCWIFMESYFFQYFFHKSRCQKESLRALVKFRHRFMEGLIDPECFHYFKKIGQR